MKERKNPRAQISLVARYRSPTAFEFVEEHCYDLSAGGMFIKSPSPAPTGTLIKLECDVDGGTDVIRGVARVVWLREQESDGMPTGMGVKFVKVDPGGRDVIRGLLDRIGTDGGTGSEGRLSAAPGRVSGVPAQPPGTATAAEVEPAPTVPGADDADEPLRDSSEEPFGKSPSAPPEADAAAQGVEEAAADAAVPEDAAAPDGAPTDAAEDGDPGGESVQVSQGPHAQDPREPLDAQHHRHEEATAGAGAAETASETETETGTETVAVAESGARPAASVAAPATEEGKNPLPLFLVAAVVIAGLLFLISRPAEPPPAPVAATPEVPAATAAPAPEPEPPKEYVLRVVTTPPGASVSAGEHNGTSPIELELGTLETALMVRAELEGHEAGEMSVQPWSFALEDGKMRRTLELILAKVETPRERRARERAEAKAKAEAEAAERAAARAAARAEREAKDKAEKEAREQARREARERAVAEAKTKARAEADARAKAEREAKAKAAAAAAAAAPKPKPKLKPEPKAEPVAKPAAEPKPDPAANVPPMQAAVACLAKGDNACVVMALEGRASNAKELELLIETYRSMGKTAQAAKHMQRYVDKYPGERRANSYRRVLDNRAKPAEQN
ncbi:MAG: PilZ domain-containing protein [Myxococcales bacterium]|nr:PilZ domain-containing protein [Myxococcales bacterium]